MRALTVLPGRPDSTRLDDVPDPAPSDGALLVRTLAVGICGTDLEIVQGRYGTAPDGRERLILGHESLGEVVDAPPGSGVRAGDVVAGIVRRPDPVPCASCAAGEWDMCGNGRYTERGIKARDGFGSATFRVEAAFAVRVAPGLGIAGVLLEPASVLAKAWEQIERIGRRAAVWEPRTALVAGAGPVGLLAALMGVQRGLDVHVFDRVTDGPKPAIVRDLGATYHGGSLDRLDVVPDVVVECTGASAVIFDVMDCTGPGGIVCLTGISSGGRTIAVDLGLVNRTMVLENDAMFGSVNANRRHYEAAAAALAAADVEWLRRLITRRVPLSRWPAAFRREPDDVKVVLDFIA
jgi:threonine dehydrogenase-like Zn-dependent dehydrogenase